VEGKHFRNQAVSFLGGKNQGDIIKKRSYLPRADVKGEGANKCRRKEGVIQIITGVNIYNEKENE
jgi:hypothetical protein